MFNREHHIRIATVLQALNADLLSESSCYFGGGTAIVLLNNEYRESVDIDFLVSDLKGYQRLRTLLTSKGIQALARPGMTLSAVRDVKADQYGIRAMLVVSKVEVKFETVLEGRIEFERPPATRRVCGLSTLTSLDMAACKLLANSDRWADDSVFSRDLIDLALMKISKADLVRAHLKAASAYGDSVKRDLKKAIDSLASRKGRLEECMNALKITDTPKAVLWSRIRKLQ